MLFCTLQCGGLFIHISQRSFAAQTDLAGVVNVNDFDGDKIVFAENIGHSVHAVIRHFGNMQPYRTGEYLYGCHDRTAHELFPGDPHDIVP